MNFDRYAGMASAAALLLIFAIVMWTGMWGPLWQKMNAGDVLAAMVAVVGWVVTISIGWRAFSLAQRQITLGNEQLALQQRQIEMQQRQIAEDREKLRRLNFAQLDKEFRQISDSVDRLATAGAYLYKLVERFPDQGKLDGWARALFFLRRDGDDIVSRSAALAPFGYGERITTIVDRLKRMGDTMVEGSPDSMPSQGVLGYYDLRIKAAVEGIISVAEQIRQEVPVRQVEMLTIKEQRDLYSDEDHAATHCS